MFDSIMNMPWILNMQGKGFRYGRVTHGSE